MKTDVEHILLSERKTKSKCCKQNVEELSVLKTKKQTNCVSSTDDKLVTHAVDIKQDEAKPVRLLRKNALKEQNGAAFAAIDDSVTDIVNPVICRTFNLDAEEKRENLAEDVANIVKSQKVKKLIKKKKSIPKEKEELAVTVSKKKTKKQTNQTSGSLVVEDIEPENQLNEKFNKRSMSTDSFHSASGSLLKNGKENEIIDTVTSPQRDSRQVRLTSDENLEANATLKPEVRQTWSNRRLSSSNTVQNVSDSVIKSSRKRKSSIFEKNVITIETAYNDSELKVFDSTLTNVPKKCKSNINDTVTTEKNSDLTSEYEIIDSTFDLEDLEKKISAIKAEENVETEKPDVTFIKSEILDDENATLEKETTQLMSVSKKSQLNSTYEKVSNSFQIDQIIISQIKTENPAFNTFEKDPTESTSNELNVTRSLDKSRQSSLAEPLPRATRVMFCSPVNNPVVVTEQRRKVIKSNLKGSNKSFVFEESLIEPRKPSITVNNSEKTRVKRTQLADKPRKPSDTVNSAEKTRAKRTQLADKPRKPSDTVNSAEKTRAKRTRPADKPRKPSDTVNNAEETQHADVSDRQVEAVVDDLLLLQDDGSDSEDCELNIEDNDGSPFLPVIRNAATEPACDTDMTAHDSRVLRNEDKLNDRILRDMVPDNDYFTFDWHKERTNFTGKQEIFNGTSGPTFALTDKTPVDIFYKMFDNDFIDLICRETNRYAAQEIAVLKTQGKLLPSSRLHRWRPTDCDEMIAFLALTVLQGLYPQSEEEAYFSFNGFGTMPYFARIMSYNRFCLLKSFLHFVDNETLTDRTKLSKIRPVIDHLNDKFSTLYMPSKEITIDESLLKKHGRLSFAQKIASNAAQVGVKMYELCEARSGYLWKFIVYAENRTPTDPTVPTNVGPIEDETVDRHKDETVDRPKDETVDRPQTIDKPDKSRDQSEIEPSDQRQDETIDRTSDPCSHPTNATAKIIFDLIEPLLERGHTLVMDNFYNSPLLFRYLKKHKTDCFGTLRLNREFVPDSLKTLKKTDLRQGEVVASYCSDLSMMVWRDVNLVSLISTYHHLQDGKQTYKPKIVLDYNKSMGGVDRKDHFLTAQPMERVRHKVWYRKVFRRLLNTAVFNAYVIFSSHNPKVTHRQFRITMAEDLLKIHRRIDLTTEPRLYVKNDQMTMRTPNPQIVDDDHFPARSGAKKARCCLCTRQKRNARTIWKCIQCNVSLCIEHCFREYHKQDN